MKRNMKRSLFLVCCLVLLLSSLTGCINSGTNLAIHRDGSVDYTVNYRMNYAAVADAFGGDLEQAKEYVNQILEGTKGNIEALGLSADYTDTSDEAYGGLQFTIHFDSVEDMNLTLAEVKEQGGAEGNQIAEILEQVEGVEDESRTTAVTMALEATPRVGNGDGSIIHVYSGHHLFYDTYQVKGEMTIENINFMGDTLNELGKPADVSAGEFLEQEDLYEIDFSVSVPSISFGTKQNNASLVENRTYHWKTDSKVYKDPEKQEKYTPEEKTVVIDFTTNVPTTFGLVLIGVLGLLLLVVIVLILVRLKKSKKTELTDEEGNSLLDSAEAEFYGTDKAETDDNADPEPSEKEVESFNIQTDLSQIPKNDFEPEESLEEEPSDDDASEKDDIEVVAEEKVTIDVIPDENADNEDSSEEETE